MRIALIGTRGVPAAYGGFETACEEIGARLVARGHEVTVYCRGREQTPRYYLGMRCVDLPAVKHRTAETLSHTALSVAHAVIKDRPDVAIVFNAANSALLPVLRAAKIPVALHTDGLEWRRGKWGKGGQKFYLRSEALGVHFADALISDAEGIAEYYKMRYQADSNVIAYGAATTVPSPEPLARLGLRPGQYHLVVARFEPENHVDVILEGMRRSTARMPLVVVGGVPYPTEHSRKLQEMADSDPRIKLLGGVWDQELLDSLYGHAAVYLHGHSVGGTNPSLLRAMGAGAAVAAYDVSFNRGVLDGADEDYWSDAVSVAHLLEAVETVPGHWAAKGAAHRVRIGEFYQWDDVAQKYEALVAALADGTFRRRTSGLLDLRAALTASRDEAASHGPWDTVPARTVSLPPDEISLVSEATMHSDHRTSAA